MRVLTVPAGEAPARLDVYLARHLPGASRRRARRAVEDGRVHLNGRRARKADTVRPGDRIEFDPLLLEPPALAPNPALAVPVLLADEYVVAVDKPAGMPAHAVRSGETTTVANFLLARYPEMAATGANPLEAGLVHRLDTQTSGVLLAARTAAAHAVLREQFASGRITKEYRAVVEGEVDSPGVVDAPLVHAAHNARKMRVAGAGQAGSRPASTRYEPLRYDGGYTLLAVRIRTGVTHQIRVHLASIGHPVAGDVLYGAAALPGAGARHLLHAYRLGFLHPGSGQEIFVVSPPPADIEAFGRRRREGGAGNRPSD